MSDNTIPPLSGSQGVNQTNSVKGPSKHLKRATEKIGGVYQKAFLSIQGAGNKPKPIKATPSNGDPKTKKTTALFYKKSPVK